MHPFRKSLAELRIGDSVTAGPRTVTLDDIAHFAEFTGDRFYAHTDAEAAAANPFFDGIVAHGYLVVSLAAGLFVDPAPGPVLANYGIDNLRFLTPVNPGDELTVSLTCKAITPRGDADHGEVRWDADVVNQDGERVARYDVLTMVAKEWPAMTAVRRARPRRQHFDATIAHDQRIEPRDWMPDALPQDADPPGRPARALRDHRHAARGQLDHPRAVAAAQGDPAGQGAGRGRPRACTSTRRPRPSAPTGPTSPTSSSTGGRSTPRSSTTPP